MSASVTTRVRPQPVPRRTDRSRNTHGTLHGSGTVGHARTYHVPGAVDDLVLDICHAARARASIPLLGMPGHVTGGPEPY
eukprot:990094-Prymnesium_polylepis.1